jgi:hypothetical protein
MLPPESAGLSILWAQGHQQRNREKGQGRGYFTKQQQRLQLPEIIHMLRVHVLQGNMQLEGNM